MTYIIAALAKDWPCQLVLGQLVLEKSMKSQFIICIMVFGSWRYGLEWQRTHQFEMVCTGSYCHVQLVLRRRAFSASETGSAATLVLTVRLKRTQGKRWWTYDSWTWSGSNPRRASVLLTLGQTPGWIWEADTAHPHTHKFLAPCDALLETSRQPFLLDYQVTYG